jgi:probable HAF family extracellular repeat protein
MVDLGVFGEDFTGNAQFVSDDGNVVAGSAFVSPYTQHAFRWTKETGMVDLGTLRKTNPELGVSVATALSRDGSTIVGYSDTDVPGQTAAFIYRTKMENLENFLGSYDWLANNTDMAITQTQWRMGGLLDVDHPIAPGQTSYVGLAGVARSTQAATNDIDYSGSTLMLSVARAVGPKLTVGATLADSGKNTQRPNFKLLGGTSLAVRADYVADPGSRQGLQLRAALAVSQEDNDITRGVGLQDVDWTTGQAKLDSTAARLGVGYTFLAKQGWRITPNADVTRHQTRREAYKAQGLNVLDRYDELNISATYLNLGVTAQTRLARNGSMTLGLGVEGDIEADRAVITGSNEVFGYEVGTNRSATNKRNEIRPNAFAAYSLRLNAKSAIGVTARVSKPVFGDELQNEIGVRYGVSF